MRERARWYSKCELDRSLDVLRERAAVGKVASHHESCNVVANIKSGDTLALLNDVPGPVAAAYSAFNCVRPDDYQKNKTVRSEAE